MSNPVGKIYKKRDVKDRLEQNTIHNKETGCWIFMGTVGETGYASIWWQGKMQRVNRLSAHLFLGLDLANKKQVACHKDDKCNNRRCWNPEHLYVGTQQQNVQDAIKKGTFHYGTDNVNGGDNFDKDKWMENIHGDKKNG